MTDQRNLLIAIALSIAILLGFQFLYEKPRTEKRQADLAQQRTEEQAATPPSGAPAGGTAANAPGAAAPTVAPVSGAQPPGDRAAVLSESGRVRMDTPRLHGSISTTGSRIDGLTLADYHETVDPHSPEIELLSPAGTPQPYYAEYGWVPDAGSRDIKVPDANTRWTADGTTLTPDHPVTLTWDNGQGQVFEKTMAVDKNYMFTVTQRVRNNSDRPVGLLPYGLVSRHGTPPTLGYYILHEGPLGVFDGTLHEYKYKDLIGTEGAKETAATTGGWIGITDKYWLVSLVPDQKAPVTMRVNHVKVGEQDRYQVDYTGQAATVSPGQTAEMTDRLFAGAKQVRLLDAYSKDLGIPKFDLAIDFGWFYFLTKPFFYALDYLGRLFGNFGVAILVVTVLV